MTSPRIFAAVALCLVVFAEAHQHSAHGKKESIVNSLNQARRSRKMESDQDTVNEVETPRAEEDSMLPMAEIALLQKVYEDCSAQPEVTACLKTKALNALSRAVDQESIQLTDGLTLVKQNGTESSVAEPRDFSGLTGEDKLDAQLKSKFMQLFDTHTLSLDLASEARGKSKKVLPYLLLGAFTTVSIVGGIALKTLAAIAGKALIASKVALTIAGIIALKKLFSHDGGHGETTFQVHADGHNRRNLYVVRPARQPTVDPYRYYYDQTMSSIAV